MNEFQGFASHFHFLRPAWLLLLPALALLGAWRLQAKSASPWRRVMDQDLLDALLQRDSSKRVWRGRNLLFAALPLLATLALAGPAWRELPQPLLARKAGLVVVLDLSEGMRAGDLAPSRDARARFKIADLLAARGDGQIGLVAYAGDAFTVAPLTDDAATLRQLLDALDPDVMPLRGQRLDRAILQAADLLHDAGFASGRILVLAQEANTRDQQAARAVLARGYRIDVIGVGTSAGAPVPVPGGGFQRDADGAIVLARLDEDGLGALASEGGGSYQTLRADGADLEALGVLANVEGEAAAATDHQSLRYADEGPWLLLLALPLAALLFRRGWLFVLPIALLGGLPRPASAFDWQDLWQRPDQQAWQALQAGRHDQARGADVDPAVSGAAAYREDDYAAAAERFAQAVGADAQYNRGNALAQSGKLEEALAAYDAALQSDPQHADAKANRDIVEQALKQQQQQQDQQQSGQDDKPGQQGQDGQSSDQSQDGASDEGQSPESKQDGEAQPDQDRKDADSDAGETAEDDSGESRDSQDADQPPDAEAESQQAKDAAEQAHREAVEQALQAQQQDAQQDGPPAQALQEIDPAETEKQQAAEQWLRRIPDDPGGLLRRKFALEHRRRVLEGDDQ